MKKEYINLPNSITLMRIIGTLVLLFVEPMTTLFFIIYTFTGFTDAVDGLAARLTNSVSEFGSKLDSVADLLFYTVMLIKICPILLAVLPESIWIAVAFILAVRISAYIVSAVRCRKFASLHTLLNKMTSFVLFFVPYIIHSSFAVYICWATCLIAILSSVEELIIHIRCERKEQL